MENKLEHMFELQMELQRRLGTFDKIQNDSDKQQFINQNILALHEEATEIMRETAYKNPDYVKFGWKKNQNFNYPNMKEEIVDIFHFVMNLSFMAGMDAEEFYEIYCKKNGVNHERQQNEY